MDITKDFEQADARSAAALNTLRRARAIVDKAEAEGRDLTPHERAWVDAALGNAEIAGKARLGEVTSTSASPARPVVKGFDRGAATGSSAISADFAYPAPADEDYRQSFAAYLKTGVVSKRLAGGEVEFKDQSEAALPAAISCRRTSSRRFRTPWPRSSVSARCAGGRQSPRVRCGFLRGDSPRRRRQSGMDRQRGSAL